MLTVDAVYKRYGKQTALENVSLVIQPGEIVSLIGKSGSGKSTLSRLILALEKPTKGSIRWNDKDVYSLRGKCLYRNIQPVFQDNAGCFNPRRLIGDSLCDPMKYLLGLDVEMRKKRALELIQMVDLSENILKCYPHELSGGQQKRICIARAISVRPKLLILDEAVSGLDTTVMVKILELLKTLQLEIGCGALFITHDIRAALYMSKTISVMMDGRLVETVKNVHSPSDFTHPFSIELMKQLQNKTFQGGHNEKDFF